VEEKVEVELEEENINLLTCFLDGLSLKQAPIEYKTKAAYEARFMMEHDGSLTWQNPHGHYEGGKVWKLDIRRSDADKLRWICEVDSPGKLPEVFFWRRVPEVPTPEVHLHGNNVLCWHGLNKMLHKLLQRGGRAENKASMCSDSSEDCDVVGCSPSHSALPNLLGKRDQIKVGSRNVMVVGSSPKLLNLLGDSSKRTKASIEKKPVGSEKAYWSC